MAEAGFPPRDGGYGGDVDSERRITLSAVPLSIRILGLVITAFGGTFVVLIVSGMGGIQFGENPARIATPGDAWLPMIFVLLGLGITLIRYEQVFDGARRSNIRILGLGPWVRQTETTLGPLTHVEIGRAEERGSGSGRYTAIPVTIVGPHEGRELGEPRSFVEARNLAERVARVLALPVSLGEGAGRRLVSADDLCRPVADTEQPGPAELMPPSGTKIRLTDLPRGVLITFPMPVTGFAITALVGLPALLAAGCLWYFRLRPALAQATGASTALSALQYMPFLAVLVVGAIGVLLLYHHGAFGGSIRVSAVDGLRGWGTRMRANRIRALEIIDDSATKSGIKVVADSTEYMLCRGQSAAELRWVRALILRHLRG